MSESNLLSVKQFAEALQIPASTIRYYDTIGLLPATTRGGNSYRYYSTKQITTANVIILLQAFLLMMTKQDYIRILKNGWKIWHPKSPTTGIAIIHTRIMQMLILSVL